MKKKENPTPAPFHATATQAAIVGAMTQMLANVRLMALAGMSPDQISEAMLRSLIDYCASHKVMTVLSDRMTVAAGKTIARQQIEFWLHRDAAKRKQPRLGMGLLLMAVGEQLMGET